jgi:predicted nucleic acid-binding protein
MLRLYLDSSVFSAYYDSRVRDRQEATQQFWIRLPEFEAATSDVARSELRETADTELRGKLLKRLGEVRLLSLTDEMRHIGGEYVAQGAFSLAQINDALHVAAAVLTRHDILVSWNFKHLVNRRRRAQVNQISISLGLPTIEILAPPEV